jgi:hypothetical protein
MAMGWKRLGYSSPKLKLKPQESELCVIQKRLKRKKKTLHYERTE